MGLSLRPTGYGSRPHRGPPLPLRLPPAPSRVFLLPLFHVRLLSFFFFKHFYLPPCRLFLPRSPPSPLCFSLTRLPLPTLRSSPSFSLPSSTTASSSSFPRSSYYSRRDPRLFHVILVTFRQRKSTRRMYRDFFSSNARDVDVLDSSTRPAPRKLHILVRLFVINGYPRCNNQHKSRE